MLGTFEGALMSHRFPTACSDPLNFLEHHSYNYDEQVNVNNQSRRKALIHGGMACGFQEIYENTASDRGPVWPVPHPRIWITSKAVSVQ